jgi:hypothetical protein
VVTVLCSRAAVRSVAGVVVVLELKLLAGDYAICRLSPASSPPAALLRSTQDVVSITWTAEELSIVCPSALAPEGARIEQPWRCLRVEGPLDLAMTGVLASLTAPLADAGIAVFAVSTYDTDYLLVRSGTVGEAARVLKRAGYRLETV